MDKLKRYRCLIVAGTTAPDDGLGGDGWFAKDADVAELEAEVDRLKVEIEELQEQIETKSKRINSLWQSIREGARTIQALRAEIAMLKKYAVVPCAEEGQT